MSPSWRRRPAARIPAPTSYTQAEQRERRRQHMRNHYRGAFNLAAEVEAITAPLAAQVAALPSPAAMLPVVLNVADAVHEVASTMVGMLAESRHSLTRTSHAVRDLAQRPTAPQVTDADLIAGSWAAALTAHVEPLAEPLAGLLGRALPPEADALRGDPSASERLEAVLRVLDSAARELERRVPRVRERQEAPSVEENNRRLRERQDAERAQRVLSKLESAAR